jgi:hypothetical protein
MKHGYAKSELREVIKTLVMGEKDVRKRLISIASMVKLNENDFPVELKEEWKWIIFNLTKKEPLYLSNGEMQLSSIENTMRSIHNSTGSKIAERIFQLYLKLQEY